jgi:hypothetical protein
MVHKCQKTGKCASGDVKKVAGEIDYDDADEFASTKHKGLPEKKKKKKKLKEIVDILGYYPSFMEYMAVQEGEALPHWQDGRIVLPGGSDDGPKYLVYSPSRFSYMGWTLDPMHQKLRPCHRRTEMSKSEAEALAKAVGDGEVVPHQKPATKAPEPEPADGEYW